MKIVTDFKVKLKICTHNSPNTNAFDSFYSIINFVKVVDN